MITQEARLVQQHSAHVGASLHQNRSQISRTLESTVLGPESGPGVRSKNSFVADTLSSLFAQSRGPCHHPAPPASTPIPEKHLTSEIVLQKGKKAVLHSDCQHLEALRRSDPSLLAS